MDYAVLCNFPLQFAYADACMTTHTVIRPSCDTQFPRPFLPVPEEPAYIGTATLLACAPSVYIASDAITGSPNLVEL